MKLGRRFFLRGAALGVTGAALGCRRDPPGKGGDDDDSVLPTDTGDTDIPVGPTGDTGRTDTVDTGPSCAPTDPDIEGPYWAEGIPIREDLDVLGEGGEPLTLEGVIADEGCQPRVGAVVALWHADPDGDYHRNDVDMPFYGQTATDDQGRYRFSTVIPGRYLNGASYRPAHLHVKVFVDGVELLTTQLYFAGDPYNETDPWYDPAREIAPDAEGHATFDLVV